MLPVEEDIMEICSSSGEAQLVQKSFTRFFLPSLLSCLGLAAGGLADCIFVGNAIGPVGMTAISTPVSPVVQISR